MAGRLGASLGIFAIGPNAAFRPIGALEGSKRAGEDGAEGVHQKSPSKIGVDLHRERGGSPSFGIIARIAAGVSPRKSLIPSRESRTAALA